MAAALKDLILRGEMPPGSDHLEAELGAMLGVSRTPVREAAVMLQAQGSSRSVPGGACASCR